MKKKLFSIGCFLLIYLSGINAQDVTSTYLTNPSFETGDLTGWTLTGADGYAWNTPNNDGDGTQDEAYNAGIWNNPIGDVEYSQTVTGLTNGYYRVGCLMTVTDITSWTDGVSKRISTQRLFANEKSVMYGSEADYSAQNLAILQGMEEITFAGLEPAAAENGPFYPIELLVEVTDGNLVIGSRTNGTASEYEFDFTSTSSDKGFYKLDGFNLTHISDLLLGSLAVDGDPLTVDPTQINYKVSLESDSYIPEVTATPQSDVSIEIFPATTVPGKTEIKLTSQDGTYSQSYFVNFEAPLGLASLTSSAGTFIPEFTLDNDIYELTVPYGISTVQLTAVPTVDGATVAMFDGFGNEIMDGMVTYDKDEGVDVEIIVTALDGATEVSYYVSIFPDDEETSAFLEDIELSAGKFTMDFVLDSTWYQAILPYGTTSVEVTGVPAAAGATVTGGGTIDVSGGSGSTTITVTSEDGNATMEYMVDLDVSLVDVGMDYYFVNEATDKYVVTGNIGADPTLEVALKGQGNQIWKLVESGVEGQYYIQNQEGNYIANRPVTDGNWHFVIREELTGDQDSCRFEIEEFEPGRFYVYSVIRMLDQVNVAQVDKKIMMGPNDANLGTTVYSDKWASSGWHADGLTVWNILPQDSVVPPYDNYLSDLSIDVSNISPSFESTTQSYSVTLPPLTTSLTISATPREGTSVVTGTGTFDVSDGKGVLTVTCTATYEGVEYSREYTIAYVTNVDLTLTHSYPFADGTAKDVVGNAHGTVMGGTIDEGIYLASQEGHHISFPGDEIKINTYPSITVEAYTLDVDTLINGTYTMLTYFGNTNPDNGYGVDHFWTSLGTGGNSVAVISCLNYTSPFNVESRASSAGIMDDGLPHHLVAILNNDSISLYIDGLFAGSALNLEDNKINNLSTMYAYLCKSGYNNDPTYLGKVLEYNIYAGEMDEQTIANRAFDYPLEDGNEDATLSDLTLDGLSIEGFAPTTLKYVDTADVVPTVDATAKVTGASASVTQASGVPGSATVLVTAADGSTQVTYTVEFVKPTAMKDVTPDFMNVYPTVTDGVFTVSTQGKSAVATVYDLSGKMVLQKNSKAENMTIHVPDAGMYLVKVQSEGATGTFKVLKTK